jgi:hypothetical protein
MLDEKLEDIPRFSSYLQKSEIYGGHFQRKLQERFPDVCFVGRMIPEICYGEVCGLAVSTSYLVGKKVEGLRTGLGRILFGRVWKGVDVSVELIRDKSNCSVLVRDDKVRDVIEEIVKGLDEESGEGYFSCIAYGQRRIIDFKQVKMPSPTQVH